MNKVDKSIKIIVVSFLIIAILASAACTKLSNKDGLKVRGLNGPYSHTLYYATSSDGFNWQKSGRLLFEHASVPGAIIKDGVIYLYFVDASGEEDQLSVAISKDMGNTYEKQKVNVEGLNSNEPVDPHPELLPDGTIRLYYFCSVFSKSCYSKREGGAKVKHKYFLAESADGLNFKGSKAVYEGEQITDPDVFNTGSDWRILANNGAMIDLLVSDDGGLTFNKVKTFDHVGVVCDTFNFSGTFRTFCNERSGIVSHTGANHGELSRENGTRISGDSESEGVGDVSIIQLPDSTYIMFYKAYTLEPIGRNQGPEEPQR